MNRISKYRESFLRFIKDKCQGNCIDHYVYDMIKGSDLVFPILLLTVMNNRNKKNQISMQGYCVATCIELLNCLTVLIEKKEIILEDIGLDRYLGLFGGVIVAAGRFFQMNCDSIKGVFSSAAFLNIVLASMGSYCGYIESAVSLMNLKFVQDNVEYQNDVIEWFIKDNTALIESYKKNMLLSKKVLNEYIAHKNTTLCEMAIVLGWIMGGGDVKEIEKLKRIAKNFSMVHKISRDFENLEDDITNGNRFNYVLNYGIQASYEQFTDSKHRFTEEAMMIDIYTDTIKEIVKNIDQQVDDFIDQTSPDIKSVHLSSRS